MLLTKLIADRIVYNFLPLSIVESSELQAILHEAEPSCIVPKRKYFPRNAQWRKPKSWIGCTDHLINLCVTDIARGLDEVKNILSTVRYIILYTRQSHLANEILHKFQRSLGLIDRQFIFDVVTRWNSTLYMLQRFVEEKVCITACLNEKRLQKHFSSTKISKVIQWNNLEELINVLDPFEAATQKLSVDSSPTLSIVLPVVTTLITRLENRSNDSLFLQEIKGNLRRSVEERFKDVYQNKLMLLCTVWHPRWKDFGYLQCLLYQNHSETLALLTKLQAFKSKTLAYLFLEEQFHILFGNTSVVSPSNVQDEPTNKQYGLFDIMITNRNTTSSKSHGSELLMYENEREINRN
ncbi:unnamed protein product [Rotaria magnacalcarata]|uniref:Zinc finger BED domain-containing protein 4 n=2 Tax=Rotaria magnacalcarata TaxID=392030 RepID=A0A816QMI7_9BILA|nr:unnamed protein product [Rotaria magnacalcarata]